MLDMKKQFEKYCGKKQSCQDCPFDKEDDMKGCLKAFGESPLMKSYDFYIAAPFFSPEQVMRVELVENMLKAKGLTFFSPRTDSAVADINNPENRKKVFALNHESILKSNGVIAITDGKDPGTIWEAGYAYAKDIPVIYIAFTLGHAQFNLMLAESGKAACRTKEELSAAIDGQEIYFQGNIE